MTEQQKLTFTALQQRLDSLMLRDRLRFSRRLHGVKKVKNPDAQQAIFQEMAKEIDQAAGKVLLREAARPEITYPDNLPVSQKKQDILEAIRDHQVVIVAGETGSGKTTQLPKICMELGRGIKGLIGHTQPRRLAARTVANRIAEELKTEPGGCIGYKVRFSDHVSDNTMVKLMTDGILLAEIQQDRLLMQYDTVFAAISGPYAIPSAKTNFTSVMPIKPRNVDRYGVTRSVGPSLWIPPRLVITMAFLPVTRPSGPFSV